VDPDLEPDPGQATPIFRGSDAPLTRRELRARERAAEASAALDQSSEIAALPPAASMEIAVDAPSEAPIGSPAPEQIVLTEPLPKSACEARPLRMPPLVTRSIEPPKLRRRRAWVGKGASFVAMLFVAGMAVATSLPANAFVTPDAVADSQPAGATKAGAQPKPALQNLTSAGDIAAQAVVRDVYKVKTIQHVAAASHINIANTFTNDPNGTIQWPFPVGVPIASYFGPRIAPTAGASSFHEGVDFDPGRGAPIQVIADGVVREVAPYNDNALGVHVIVDHMIDGQLVSSVYGHMTPGSIKVTQGQTVKVGDILGLVGSTGISTGPHLHFEIRLNGTTPVDPYAWLKQHAN
jgi:murein DD-endopeptidase MepM/ murein hydrolase activator NlpD